MLKIKRLNPLWFQSPLLFFPKICWTGEASVCSQMMAFPRVTAHCIFWVMDCGHTSVPIPSDISFCLWCPWSSHLWGFFLWHFWFPLGLKRFAPSSFSGCSWSCMKGVHLLRDAFKEAGCEPSFASLATSFPTCCFYFWPTQFQMTLIGSQMLHFNTRGICSSWEPPVPAVPSPVPELPPHRHSTESFSA